MDTALILKQGVDDNISFTKEEINEHLLSSTLINRLTSACKEKPLFAIWRLIALSEIPYTAELDYTQNLIVWILENLFCQCGFSFTGKKEDIVPCYNAMIIEALSKLGETNTIQVRKSVQWIKDYQFFHRGGITKWTEKGIDKYGGCLKSTPCYIGIAKTLKSLIHYKKASGLASDYELKAIIDVATVYVKQQHFCYRKSTGEPISKHILEPAFPPSYVLNIVELLEIAHLTDSVNSRFAEKMMAQLKSIQNDDGSWGVGYQYKSDGYISFDGAKKKADWISYLISKFLSNETNGKLA